MPKIVIIKWDLTSLDIIWTKIWTTIINGDRGYGIWGNSDGEIFICGNSNAAAILCQIDADNGNFLKNSTFGGEGSIIFQAITGNDTRIYTSGYTDIDTPVGTSDGILLELDHNLEMVQNITWDNGTRGNEFSNQLAFNNVSLYTNSLELYSSYDEFKAKVIKWDIGTENQQQNILQIPQFSTQNQTISSTNLTLQWSSVINTDSYNLYINGSFNSSTTSTEFEMNFSQNGIYLITLTAVNESGESPQSQPIMILVQLIPITPSNNSLNFGLILGGIIGSIIGILLGINIDGRKLKEWLGRVKRFWNLRKRLSHISSRDLQRRDRIIDELKRLPSNESTEIIPPKALTLYKSWIDRLIEFWNSIPQTWKDILYKLTDKYMKFADQATLIILNNFQAISNDLISSYQAFRSGEVQNTILKLSEVTRKAEQAKFIDLEKEAKIFQREITIEKKVVGEK